VTRLFPVLLLLALPLFPQPVLFGVRGGLPLTDAHNAIGVYSGASRDWTVGPTVELRLPLNLGVEFDALYRKIAYRVNLQGGGQAEFTSSQWQFPLLAKYRFPGIVLHPFVDGGVVFNQLSFQGGLGPSKGIALGGGMEVKLFKVRFMPELRYVRMGEGGTLDSRDILRFQQSQALLLVGITF
jgi:hypothetical protein